MKGFKRISSRGKQDYKSRLLEELVPELDPSPWVADLHRIDRDRPAPRIQTHDRGWIELDPKAGIVRTWGKPGRATALAEAIAESQGWHVESLSPAGDLRASREQASARRSPDDMATWWRERGYDAVPAQDGVWIDVGSARIQDVGDQMRLHGALTPEAARALVHKASEAWGGEAELQGVWSQPDKDLLWLEAQRSGVRLGACEPSVKARAAWEAETAEAARRADTLGLVKASNGPARLLLDAAAGDVSALAKLDPDLRAFVGQYLDDDQRAELGKAEIADIMTEMARFRELGAEERARAERERGLKPTKVADPLDMAPPPAPAPGL
uniref:Large polyvalent protein-associated domain-containing protein n=1 Tax=Bosea sp. NBC_00436 TaxID=2969620 RepID=A0A9E8CN57_9HYPH